ncbi:MAG: YheU family protein [Gammaproteobacteria bacterium]|nr:YheU family protein [Gammaproteobacteria bacterium]NIR98871.1 YheU family protein [Gammaproteobacteria bacterium]NIT63992.1 YheU family protein [Gammaproteobacteria bacterium]NIV19152.1 YheU family protein [Gammaproteobacteria bacterium]NIX10321.1 YheU family protein [Gammaproteobacteria bacterium]
MEIPYDHLEPDTLRALVEEYVTRAGTDYGEVEVPLPTKVRQVIARLERGEAVITYDPETKSCDIVPC